MDDEILSASYAVKGVQEIHRWPTQQKLLPAVPLGVGTERFFPNREEEVKDLLCWFIQLHGATCTNDIPFLVSFLPTGSPRSNRRTSDMCCQAQSHSRILCRNCCVRLHAILLLSFTWLAQVGSLHLENHLVIRSTSIFHMQPQKAPDIPFYLAVLSISAHARSTLHPRSCHRALHAPQYLSKFGTGACGEKALPTANLLDNHWTSA